MSEPTVKRARRGRSIVPGGRRGVMILARVPKAIWNPAAERAQGDGYETPEIAELLFDAYAAKVSGTDVYHWRPIGEPQPFESFGGIDVGKFGGPDTPRRIWVKSATRRAAVERAEEEFGHLVPSTRLGSDRASVLAGMLLRVLLKGYGDGKVSVHARPPVFTRSQP